ncbi:short-chain dehydrogenase, partial [Clavibacter michiganensis subsp. insidiosus]
MPSDALPDDPARPADPVTSTSNAASSPEPVSAAFPGSAIDPADLATALRVLGSLADIDEEHPDFVAVRRATASMFKEVKKARRLEKREAVASADRAVVAATATGAPD